MVPRGEPTRAACPEALAEVLEKVMPTPNPRPTHTDGRVGWAMRGDEMTAEGRRDSVGESVPCDGPTCLALHYTNGPVIEDEFRGHMGALEHWVMIALFRCGHMGL